MISAHKVGSSGKVGVAPGTATLALNGSTVTCPTPGASAFQVQSLGPPSLLDWVRPRGPRRWWTLPTPPGVTPPAVSEPALPMPAEPSMPGVPSMPTYERTPVSTNVPSVPAPSANRLLPPSYVAPSPNRLTTPPPSYIAPSEKVITVQPLPPREYDTKVTATRLPPPSTVAPSYTAPRLPPPSSVPQPIKTAASRIATAFSPYASFEQMKGAVQRVLRGGRGSLGMVLAPYGDISPLMYSETSSVMEPFTYCGPFDPQYDTRGEAGYYYDTPLGGAGLGMSVPSDLQLSRVYGYTPLVHGWTPFKNVTWQNGTWTPPNGRGGDAYGGIGPALKGAGRRWRSRLFGDAVENAAANVIVDPASTPAGQALFALEKHQDRIFFLSAISTAAVAATALVNILKDRRDRKGKSKSVEHSVQSLPVSGARRRRSR